MLARELQRTKKGGRLPSRCPIEYVLIYGEQVLINKGDRSRDTAIIEHTTQLSTSNEMKHFLHASVIF
eukprot:scaffold1507_cov202-Alexandrium_tamarense.AAC.2